MAYKQYFRLCVVRLSVYLSLPKQDKNVIKQVSFKLTRLIMMEESQDLPWRTEKEQEQ
jgi:hypothetical protein